eukprot:bmy_02024T0
MADNQSTWWQHWTDTTYIKPLNHMVGGTCLAALPKLGILGRDGALEDHTGSGGARAAHEPYLRPEEQVLINRRDITSSKDAWDMQEFIIRMYVKELLRHPAFQLLLAVLLKHYELFSTIDDIVLTILICEILLGWLNGFWIFWKDGWNILNFLIIFILLLGFFVNELSAISITYTLRALRLVHVCMAVEPLARIIRVILQSVPDMANIMALILFFMLVFSVFGVTLFGAFVPMHFQNMQVALYTLFICITQDGWVDIYVEIGGAIYFAIFITVGAFIGINLLVVVVTTNLEQMMKAGEQGQQRQIAFSETGNEEGNGNNELPLVHCVVARLQTSGVPQEPFMGGLPTNLSEDTFDNFCLVLEAIQENLMQIVDEVRSIRFNQEQEEELMQRHLSWSLSRGSGSSTGVREMTCQQDLITALVNREKVQLPSPTQSVLTSPPHPAQPQPH